MVYAKGKRIIGWFDKGKLHGYAYIKDGGKMYDGLFQEGEYMPDRSKITSYEYRSLFQAIKFD